MRVYGIGYKLQLESNDESTRNLCITFTYVKSESDQEGFIRLPRTWKFLISTEDGFMPQRFGASEIRGLFGGIENQNQKAYSEASERAIGEVMTVLLCEILDGEEKDAYKELTLLFSVNQEYQTELDKKNLPDKLRQEFTNNEITLSQNPTVSVKKIGNTWQIKDENQIYTVKKEKDKLNIYKSTLDDIYVMIFGPALPKVAGRFASLRPPSNINILWICPKPFPKWLADEANETLLVPDYNFFSEAYNREGWEDDPLIKGFNRKLNDSEDRVCSIQYFNLYTERETSIQNLEKASKGYGWLEDELAKALLPREIVSANEQVSKHIEEPYSKEQGLHTSLREIEQPNWYRDTDKGWSFKWKMAEI